GDDTRVHFKPFVDPSAVIDTIAEHDVLAVPSQWMETGPLVVLEAFAAGVPVIGSALGGIAELVSDGSNGLLVDGYRSALAWAAALTRLDADRALLETFSAHIQPPADMNDVAADMIRLYETVLQLDVRSSPAVCSAS